MVKTWMLGSGGWGDEGRYTPRCWEVGDGGTKEGTHLGVRKWEMGGRGKVHTWLLESAPGLELLMQLGSFTFSPLASPVTSKYKLRGPTCGISAVSRK